MLKGQKSRGKDGYENFLFPLEYLYCTQGEHDTDYYAMDFIGYDENGKVNQCPMYAPFTCRCVYVGNLETNTPITIWESLDFVNFVDGRQDYATILVAHDDEFSNYRILETREQGEMFAKTGNTGTSSADHTHIIVGYGRYEGLYTTPNGHYTLVNQEHIPNCIGVNDTIIIEARGIDWQYFTNIPVSYKKDLIVLSICNALKWSI